MSKRQSYLKYGQNALIETIKVASGLFSQWIIVKSGAKNLHSQKSKDADEQKEEEQKWGNRLNTVGEGFHQIGKRFPIPERSIDDDGQSRLTTIHKHTRNVVRCSTILAYFILSRPFSSLCLSFLWGYLDSIIIFPNCRWLNLCI